MRSPHISAGRNDRPWGCHPMTVLPQFLSAGRGGALLGHLTRKRYMNLVGWFATARAAAATCKGSCSTLIGSYPCRCRDYSSQTVRLDVAVESWTRPARRGDVEGRSASKQRAG